MTPAQLNPDERIDLLLRDLRASRDGLSQREVERRRRHRLLILLPFPFIVWGADELRRYVVRRGPAGASAPAT